VPNLNTLAEKRTIKGTITGLYIVLIVFGAVYGIAFNKTLNQLILWVGGPLMVAYVVVPELLKRSYLPREYLYYASLLFFALLGFLNIIDTADFFRYLRVIFANLLLMLVLYNGVKNSRDLRFVMQMLLIASLAVVVSSYFLTVPSEEDTASEFFRMAGLTGNANGLANHARVSIILTLFFLIQKPNFFWQLVYYNIIAICFYSIIISASRSNFANGLLVIGAFYGLKYFSGARIIILALLIFIAGNVLIEVIEGFLSDFYLYDRLTRTNTISDAVEVEARVQLYLTAWMAFWENPFFGVGLNQFKHYSGGKISHTDLLDIFVQLGFVAGILYLSIYIRIYRAIQKSKRLLVKLGEKQFYHVLLIAFISELVFGLANPNWFTQLQMIFLSVMIIILYKYLPVLEKYSS
jgi:hypothetical protein